MPVATFPIGPLETNSYVLSNGSKALAIDVGGEPNPILRYLNEHGLTLVDIVLTHLHFDHLYGVAELAKVSRAPVHTPRRDSVIAKSEAATGGIWSFPKVPPFTGEDIDEGECVLAGLPCRILHTPGHTPGSLSYYFPSEHLVFTGDALFYRSVGRTDFPGGSAETLLASIREKLFTLPEETRVLPGHGPETSIGDERRNNPFCGDFS